MIPDRSIEKPPFRYILTEDDKGTRIRFKGVLDSSSAAPLLRELLPRLKKHPPSFLTVDLIDVSYLDDFGALVLLELKKTLHPERGGYRLLNASGKVKEILSLFDLDSAGRKHAFGKPPRPGTFVRLGEGTLRILGDLKYMISFLGSVTLALLFILVHPRKLRLEDTFLYMQKTGVDALPIVGLISFLLGLIMAFMSSVQLQQFGANIYVASLVSLAMVRELGPIMTAIIVAGRSGSSFAAEIGTMKISEEVDALFTMGFDPTRFLVVPKIIASVVVVPFLTLFSDLFAIAGGMIVGIFMLDLTASAYMSQTIKTLTLFDVAWGFAKSGVFALLISWIGCLRGFRVSGGAAGVGQATTSAVVSSIFLIILSDSLFAVILRYWG
ncbi:MAG: MlaE family lipid ABC transporter permease subunit [Deltaproteobacteria bacterium]|nr:MlaE family lipid ABC transporter permease subunit [Deltaproteobacteria bacterium]